MGFSPLKSGLLTFATPFGAFAMKPIAQSLIQRFGFRSLLIVNAAISVAFMVGRGMFDVTTPILVILPTLFWWLSHSLQFTALNALGFGDIPEKKVSGATTFFSMLQQLRSVWGLRLARSF